MPISSRFAALMLGSSFAFSSVACGGAGDQTANDPPIGDDKGTSSSSGGGSSSSSGGSSSSSGGSSSSSSGASGTSTSSSSGASGTSTSSSSGASGSTSSSSGSSTSGGPVQPPNNGTCIEVNIGVGVGKTAAPGLIPLVDSGDYEIRKSCGKPVYILGVTENCGICMQELGQWSQPGNVLDQLKTAGADIVLISSLTAQGAPGSATTAAALRTRFNLGARFFIGYDTQGSGFNSFIGKRTNTGGARIAYILKTGNIVGGMGQVDNPAQIKLNLGL